VLELQDQTSDGRQPDVKDIRIRRLRLFGHLAKAEPSTDYEGVLRSLTWAAEGLEASTQKTKDNVATDIGVRP